MTARPGSFENLLREHAATNQPARHDANADARGSHPFASQAYLQSFVALALSVC